MRFEDQRALLINDLKAQGISDEKILRAFSTVARENYVLPEYREYAYRNQPLPILLSQTISQPLMIAIMMQYMQLDAENSVLEIGTGSGYQSALLAEIVKDVCSIERLEGLSLKAQQTLREQGYKNIYFRIGDGAQGWEKAYPPYKEFDKIIISAATNEIPHKLLSQLKKGGILAAPVGGSNYQVLTIVQNQDSKLVYTQHGACSFVPLISDGQ
ncbi:MAG: protein-L-isoaspartate(D-aspartate) O-methyltransferase [Candidatus Cloacimonadaceae bacterium]|nr:protein-L-isoaspartate(D-aspartate) O-methyltransferase [Candidatus Cloacimonadaceae bacterium]MDP3114604.1 protein-L-isoaspartate(D-aspartate) O-methyltransferase [Candidatus Cloacimonadaceae bacterium]